MNSILTSPLLDEARHKVRRGKEHSYLLDLELRKFSDSKPYTVVQEYDDKQSKNLFRFKVRQEAPLSTWALIIGDTVHNARSALDYIAWRLAGSVIDDVRTMFPICDCSAKFDEAERRRLKRLDPGARAAIRECQPYLRPNLKESALWLLEELDRRDKHKLLTPMQCYTFVSLFRFEAPLPFNLHVTPNSRLEHNAIVADSSGLPNFDMQMELQFSSDILFQRGLLSTTADYEVRNSVERILDAVDIVIAKFDRLLVNNPDWIPVS